MKWTNKLNLPQPLVDAITNDSYTKGDADISVTELMDPPQMRYLKNKHEDELVEDVSQRIYSLYGQVIHGILERSDTTAIAERRLSIQVSGWKVGGGMDRFVLSEGLLQDYKFTTAYKIKNNSPPEEWVKQLNIYAEIIRQNGEKVNTLQIVALLRDWSKLEAERTEDYPKEQVIIVPVPLMSSEKVVSYITERVLLHQAAMKGNYSECTKEERWAKDDVYAVMENGKKRAIRLTASKEAATLIMKPGQFIEKRPGISTRCEHYCPVKSFCSQYKKLKENK